MNTEEIVQLICEEFNLVADSEAKRKFGKLPKYTVRDILLPIVESGRVSVESLFPEMSRPTILRVLQNLFPDKPKNEETWACYILHSVGVHRCSKCTSIKNLTEFSTNNRYSGIISVCKKCDNVAGKAYRDSDLDRESIRAKEKYLANKEYYISKSIAYRRGLKDKRPAWASISELRTIYDNCPEGYHVDHIVPLNGALVSGLHVENNLQYLPAKENLSKGNKFDIHSYIHTCEYIKPYKICDY